MLLSYINKQAFITYFVSVNYRKIVFKLLSSFQNLYFSDIFFGSLIEQYCQSKLVQFICRTLQNFQNFCHRHIFKPESQNHFFSKFKKSKNQIFHIMPQNI